MKIIILDTGCIDLLYNHKYVSFQNEIQELENNGYIISSTILNFGERLSGIQRYHSQKEIKSQENIFAIHCFYKFFHKERKILYIDKHTSEIYAKIHYGLKNILKLSPGEIKCMHNDMWIASFGIQYNAMIYAKNRKDFEKIQKIYPNILFKVVSKN